MIEDGTTEGKYIEASDNISDLKRFQDFLYRHLYKHKDYEAIFVLISLAVFLLQLKLISLNPLKTFI